MSTYHSSIRQSSQRNLSARFQSNCDQKDFIKTQQQQKPLALLLKNQVTSTINGNLKEEENLQSDPV